MITITAEQARNLVQRSVVLIERRISEGITKAANDGESELKITIYDNDFDVSPIINDLENLGFKCELTTSRIPMVSSTSSSMPNNIGNKQAYYYDRDKQGYGNQQLSSNDMPNNLHNPPAISNSHGYYYDRNAEYFDDQEQQEEPSSMSNNSSYHYDNDDPNMSTTHTKMQPVRILLIKW